MKTKLSICTWIMTQQLAYARRMIMIITYLMVIDMKKILAIINKIPCMILHIEYCVTLEFIQNWGLTDQAHTKSMSSVPPVGDVGAHVQ